MGFRFIDEVANDIMKRGELSLPADSISGICFERWLYVPNSDSYNLFNESNIYVNDNPYLFDIKKSLCEAA